jgi:tryptophan synthase alpha chain
MTRLSSAFAKGRPALVCFITAGDGDTAANLDALVEGGADVIELGMPFTDPMADGPAIQAANLRSLARGTTTREVLLIADEFRERHPDIPLVLMGYANPMVRRGPEWFAGECKGCGVDGVICVDIPPEEDDELGPYLRAQGLDLIRLATPTTDAARLPGGARWLERVPVLRLGRRHHRQAAGADRFDRGQRRPHQALDRPARSRSASACARPSRPRDRPRRRRRGGRLGAGRAGRRARRGRPEHLRLLTSTLAAAVHSAERQAA